MELNLPILDKLAHCKNILIVGMGGGFDVFCGLPVYFELKQRGYTVHLANFSFSNILGLEDGTHLTDSLVGVFTDQKKLAPHFPELYLIKWFKEKRGENITLWCFQKTGARPLMENYRVLVNHLSIDGILLVDNGTDSIMRGDEGVTSTLVENAISLFAVNELKGISTRLMTAVGVGAKRDIIYPYILENVATYTRAGGCLGTCALVPQMAVYQYFEDAVLYVQNHPAQDPNVINSQIISAVRGEYGDYRLPKKAKGTHPWFSPLMTVYWFFEVATVSKYNLFLAQLRETSTFVEALQIFSDLQPFIPRRRIPTDIPR